MSSYISSQVSKLGEDLKNSTQFQVSDYKERFKVVKGTYDEILKDLIVQGFDYKRAFEFVRKFFGSDKIKFIALEWVSLLVPISTAILLKLVQNLGEYLREDIYVPEHIDYITL